MKPRLKKTGALISLLLFLCSSSFAQGRSPSVERQQFESALAVEEPSARVTSLQSFLAAHPNSNYALKAKEELVKSWAQLADDQLAGKNLDQALLSFREALAALPKQVSDRFFEETVARIPLAVSVRGYRDEALALARELETRFSAEAKRLGAIGEFYMSLEAVGDAIRVLESTAQLAPDEARVHRSLGSAYRMGLRLGDAAAEFQQAVRLDPRDKRTYYELASLYRAQGAYEEAGKLYRKQLEIEPKHTPSLKGLALTHLAQGKEDLAVSELKKMRESAGSDKEITQDNYLQTQLAFYYLAQRKVPQAKKAAELALTVEPRYSWARIAAAEVDLAEGRYFEAERHVLTALRYANFPTLYFMLGKVYLVVEDFNDALDQFAKAFSYTPTGKFKISLGGVTEREAEGLDDLLARERQAALFVAESPTTELQFNLAEALVRLDALLRSTKSPSEGSDKDRPGASAGDRNIAEIEKAATNFIEADGYRRAFRSLYVAQRLAQQGVALELAVKSAQQSLDLAEVATEAEGSLPDYPNYDRAGRLRVFRGRAADTLGQALLKLGRIKEAIDALNISVAAYGQLPEGRRALWHLAVAKESNGEEREALDLYIAGYEPPSPESAGSDVNRTIIELLYRKVHGSLQGLDTRIGKSAGTSEGKMIAASTLSQPDTKAPKSTTPTAKTPKASKEVKRENGLTKPLAGGGGDKNKSAAAVLPSISADQPSALVQLATEEPRASLKRTPLPPENSVEELPPAKQLTLPSLDWDKNLSLLAPTQIVVLPHLDLDLDQPADLPAPLKKEETTRASKEKAESLSPQPPATDGPTSTRPRLSTRPRRALSSAPDQTPAEPSLHTRRRRVQETGERSPKR